MKQHIFHAKDHLGRDATEDDIQLRQYNAQVLAAATNKDGRYRPMFAVVCANNGEARRLFEAIYLDMQTDAMACLWPDDFDQDVAEAMLEEVRRDFARPWHSRLIDWLDERVGA